MVSGVSLFNPRHLNFFPSIRNFRVFFFSFFVFKGGMPSPALVIPCKTINRKLNYVFTNASDYFRKIKIKCEIFPAGTDCRFLREVRCSLIRILVGILERFINFP